MYGLEAINANNGWAIAVVGVTIVFSGLVGLSFVISQLHKILDLWENPSKIKAVFTAKQKEVSSEEFEEKQVPDEISFTQTQKEVIKQFALLVRTMENHFSLPRLLHLAILGDLKDPYSNLNKLLNIKILIPDGSGFFTWNQELFDKTIA